MLSDILSRRPELLSEPIVISDSVRDELNLDAALADLTPSNLLPSRVAFHAGQVADARFLEVLSASTAIGYRPRPVEVVQVPKLDRTTRPAADMPIDDQILYHAIVALLVDKVPEGFVTFTARNDHPYSDFERFPLTVEGTRYVLEADAAGFFQYIDHERLAYELVGLTGQSEVAEALVRLLEAWLRSPRGLPQGPEASRLLADIYIAPADRALSRAGFRFRRYSDDYRVVGADWSEVKRAQSLIEAAFYDLGLVVAAKKLRTPKIETYRRNVEMVGDARLATPVVRAALDELEAEDYIPGLGVPQTVSTDEASRAREVFLDQIEGDRVDYLSTRLIRRALPILGRVGDPVVLERLGRTLSRFPHLTAVASTYLSLLMGGDSEPEAVTNVTGWLDSERYRHPWQEGWLLHALAGATGRHPEVRQPAARILFNGAEPWFVRGQAAIALAVHGDFPTQREFFDVFERAPAATRADFLAAASIANRSWSNRFLEGATDRPLVSSIAGLRRELFREWI